MVDPQKISSDEIKANPDVIWGSIIDFLTDYDDSAYTEIQLIARRVLNYDGEIQNAGHLNFLGNLLYDRQDNEGIKEVQEVIKALKLVEAHEQSKLLQNALAQFLDDKEQLYSKYEEYEHQYYKSIPSTEDLLEEFLLKHEKEFVEIVNEDEETRNLILVLSFIRRCRDILNELVKNPHAITELKDLLPDRKLKEITYNIETMEKHKIVSKTQDSRYKIEPKMVPLVVKHERLYLDFFEKNFGPLPDFKR